MKRLIRWIINWLYAEEIAALVQEAVDDEFEAAWPEEFRHQPEHNSVIPQEIWAAVILNLPTTPKSSMASGWIIPTTLIS